MLLKSLICTTVLASAFAANADTLPNPTYGGFVEMGTTEQGFSGSVSGPGTTGKTLTDTDGSTSSSFYVNFDPSVPSLSGGATATALGPNIAGGNFTFQMTYFVEFVGPEDAMFAPVHLKAQGAVNFFSDASPFTTTATAFLHFSDLQAIASNTNFGHTSFSLDQDVEFVPANTPLDIFMSIDFSTDTRGFGTDSLSAFVDPFFTLVGPDADKFTILLSPTIGNGTITPVPEMGTWLMLGLGLFGLGLFGSTKKGRSALSPARVAT